MKQNKIEKGNVFKTFGWKPGDGDYSVKKEVNEFTQKEKSLSVYSKKLKSILKKMKKLILSFLSY